MSLPTDLDERVWWFWRKGSPVIRHRFGGKNYRIAASKAEVHFGVDWGYLEGELVKFPARKPERSKNHDPWSWVGDADATKSKPNGAPKKKKKKKRKR